MAYMYQPDGMGTLFEDPEFPYVRPCGSGDITDLTALCQETTDPNCTEYCNMMNSFSPDTSGKVAKMLHMGLEKVNKLQPGTV